MITKDSSSDIIIQSSPKTAADLWYDVPDKQYFIAMGLGLCSDNLHKQRQQQK